MTQALEGLPTEAKEVPSPHKVYNIIYIYISYIYIYIYIYIYYTFIYSDVDTLLKTRLENNSETYNSFTILKWKYEITLEFWRNNWKDNILHINDTYIHKCNTYIIQIIQIFELHFDLHLSLFNFAIDWNEDNHKDNEKYR